jgi:hypothetical protein
MIRMSLRRQQARRHATLSACALLALGCSVARAQMPVPPPTDWVQVEVIVFRHLDTSGIADEQFPVEPVPGYPEALRFLRETGSTVMPATPAPSAAPAAPAADAGTLPLPDVAAVLPEPFVQLPATERMLAEAATRIANSRNYRLLAHLAWRQPRPERNAPDPVLVTGGQQVGEHRELEGSVVLSRTRFMHLETRLWLNDFADPASAVEGPGVELPPVPVPPSEDTMLDDAVYAAPQVPDNAYPARGEDETAGESVQTIVPAPAHVLRSVVLSENRRLRSGELHYIDHPMLGVLIKLQDYAPAQPADPADGSAAP